MRVIGLLMLAAAAGAVAAPATAQAQRAAAAAATADERLGHISVQAIGSGPPLVLIPGLSTPRELWQDIAPALAAKHRVHLVQVNGFGGDDPGENAGEGLLDGAAVDLHAYLAKHEISRAPVIGHSMGGLIGMMLAAAHPDDVGRLMIVDTFPFAAVMFDESATADAARPFAAMLKAQMAAGYSGEAGAAAAQATANSLAARPEAAAKVKAWVLRANPKVAAQAVAEAVVTDMRPRLPALTMPVTVLHPAKAMGRDETATAAFYRKQFAGTPNLTLVTVADSKHFIMLDQPGRFAAEVDAFLNREREAGR